MNVSSETFAYPTNHHHRRVSASKHSSMFVSPSPIAVNNKIRAIQTRKPRITLQSYYDFTDIRPLNIGHTAGVTHSSGTFSNLSPEKLVERSKELRLSRIAAAGQNLNPRPSVLSTANQSSLVWASYASQNGFPKQTHFDSPRMSPTGHGPIMNKPPTAHMPDIPQRSSRAPTTARQPLSEQQNLFLSTDSRHKSLPKTKSSVPKPYHRMISKSKSPFPPSNAQPLQIPYHDYAKQFNNNLSLNNNNNNNIIHLYESEEDDDNVLVMDEEFQEYLKKAIVKCADWLIQHVFDRKYEENDA